MEYEFNLKPKAAFMNADFNVFFSIFAFLVAFFPYSAGCAIASSDHRRSGKFNAGYYGAANVY